MLIDNERSLGTQIKDGVNYLFESACFNLSHAFHRNRETMIIGTVVLVAGLGIGIGVPSIDALFIEPTAYSNSPVLTNKPPIDLLGGNDKSTLRVDGMEFRNIGNELFPVAPK